MEIEYKFLIPDDERENRVRNLIEMLVPENRIAHRKEWDMIATYMDTANLFLSKKGIAFRIRDEREAGMQSSCVATVKWGEAAGEGLYRRGEINYPIPMGAFNEDMDYRHIISAECFDEKEVKPALEAAIEEGLEPIFVTDFRRDEICFSWLESKLAFSIDKGEIKSSHNSVARARPDEIFEIEVELIEGDVADLDDFVEKVKNNISLPNGEKSKYIRGLELYFHD